MNDEYEETENAIRNALAPDEPEAATADEPAPSGETEEKAGDPKPAEPVAKDKGATEQPPSSGETELFPDFDESDNSEYDVPLAKALNALKRSIPKTQTISRDDIAAMIREELAKATKASAPAASRTTLARPDGRGGMDSSTTSDAHSGDEALAAELDARIREFNRA